MRFVKDGVQRDEFWLRQDMDTEDAKKNAGELMRVINLQRAMDKAGGLSVEQKNVLVSIFMGRPPKSPTPVPLFPLFANMPINLTEAEKEVFIELRKLMFGF